MRIYMSEKEGEIKEGGKSVSNPNLACLHLNLEEVRGGPLFTNPVRKMTRSRSI